MSIELTKKQLQKLLLDQDNRVIALSGKWGTGKSFMWETVKSDSSDKVVKDAIYVSLFGVSSIEQLKAKLIQSAIPAIEEKKRFWGKTKGSIASGIKILESFHKGFGALNDFSIIFSPILLQKKLIVIDDIERKHEKLHIDEVLGFIDEFTQQHNSRFLLILNSDQLDKKEVWDLLREKVIDQEIKLITTSSEAFDIANRLTSSNYSIEIKSAITTCGVTNIRVIRKVIKVVNSILRGIEGVTDDVLWRVIPSTVLLACIHYKGIDNGPDFDFILTKKNNIIFGLIDSEENENNVKDEESSKWNQLMLDLKIYQCDDYELLVAEFLESGLYDDTKTTLIINKYILENEKMAVQRTLWDFFQEITWNHRATPEDLLDQAKKISEKSHLLNAESVTQFYYAILELDANSPLVNKVIESWISYFWTEIKKNNKLDNFYFGKYEPRIEIELNKAKLELQSQITAYDACKYVVENNAWGARQKIALNQTSAHDMEKFIRECDISQFRFFMTKMMDFCLRKDLYESSFGDGMKNFIQASINIVNSSDSGRLSEIIRKLFNESGAGSLLDNHEQE